MIDLMKLVGTPKALKATRADLTARGAEVLDPTNPYEVLRFRTCYGVGVVYRRGNGRLTATEAALQSLGVLGGSGYLTPGARQPRPQRSKRLRMLRQIIERDGPGCFFCGEPMAPAEAEGDPLRATLEHLVSVAHSGPNHLSNCFAAHEACNQKAGHLSAPEKIALRDEMRAALAEGSAAA